MAGVNVSVHLRPDETVQLKVAQYLHGGRTVWAVKVEIDGTHYPYPIFHCDTLEQVRAFVPGYVPEVAQDAAPAVTP